MWAFSCLGIIALTIAAYVYWIRPYLKTLPAFSDAWQKEASTWAAIQEWLKGRKTILIGIWGELVAFGPDALQLISGMDLKFMLGLPDLWAAWVALLIPLVMVIFRAKAQPPSDA